MTKHIIEKTRSTWIHRPRFHLSNLSVRKTFPARLKSLVYTFLCIASHLSCKFSMNDTFFLGTTCDHSMDMFFYCAKEVLLRQFVFFLLAFILDNHVQSAHSINSIHEGFIELVHCFCANQIWPHKVEEGPHMVC